MNTEQFLRDRIHKALDDAIGQTPDMAASIERRIRSHQRWHFPLAAQLAASLAIILGGVVLFFSLHHPRVATSNVVTSPTTPIPAGPGANNAWVLAQTAGHPPVLLGFDPGGHRIGTINAPDALRSADGSHLYVAGAGDGKLDIYSTVDGHIERTVALHTSTLDREALSPDGRYFGVLGASPCPPLAKCAVFEYFEVVDLSAARSVAFLPVSIVGDPSFTTILAFDGQHVYIFGNIFVPTSGGTGTPTVIVLGFDGRSLRVEQRATNGSGGRKLLYCNGLVVSGENAAGGLPYKLLPDGHTLALFCPDDGRVSWFDLSQLAVTHELVVNQHAPFWVTPVFSADGSTLYLHEGGTGQVHVVDLKRKAVIQSVTLTADNGDPIAWLRKLFVIDADAGGIARTAALSPDGRWLYAVSLFGGPGGISVIHLPDLAVRTRWIPNDSLQSVWVSADGKTIYALNQGGDQLVLLHSDGSQIAQISQTPYVSGFIVPILP